MSAAHTPGPWEIRTYDSQTIRGAVGIFSPAMRFPVVESLYGSTYDEHDCNARLIAAAPDLLDAARAALALLTDPDAEPMDADRVTDILRAAISKATT